MAAAPNLLLLLGKWMRPTGREVCHPFFKHIPRLDEHVVSRPLAVRAAVAKAGDAAVDEVGKVVLQLRIPKAIPHFDVRQIPRHKPNAYVVASLRPGKHMLPATWASPATAPQQLIDAFWHPFRCVGVKIINRRPTCLVLIGHPPC